MTATPVNNYAEIADKQNKLIRKALNGSVFIAPVTAELLLSITGTGSKPLPLPDGYVDLGYLSTDGAQWSRDVSNSEVNSWGSTSPTRSDVTTDTDTLTLTAQETKLSTLGLALGFAETAFIPDATTGEVMVKKPANPTPLHYRALSFAKDDSDAGEIYIVHYLPNAKVTNFADTPFGGGDDPIQWGATLTGEDDAEFGSAGAWFFGGPGWKALLTEMGFTP